MDPKVEQHEEEELEEISNEDLFNAMWAKEGGPNLDTSSEEDDDDDEDVGSDDVHEEDVSVKAEKVTPPPAPASQVRDPYDWIKGLPEEQREMAERLRHEALSDRGRVSALTRKVDETSAELARLRAHSKPAPAPEEGKPAAQVESEALKQLKEDYPELSKKLEAVMAERDASLKQEFDSRLTPIQQQREADAQAAAQAQMERDAADIFKTEETGVYWKDVVRGEDFTAWLELQPAFIQETAKTSPNPADGLEILRMYENAYQAAIASQAPPPQDTSQGDKVKARRTQRKATTVSPGSKSVGSDADGVSGDYDTMFNAMFG